MGAPIRTSAFSGQVPTRLDGHPTMGPIAGMGVWRGLRDFEHATICRAFNLDPARFYFDLPSSVRGTGSNSTGNRGSRIVNGYVMCAGFDKPVGKLTIVRDSDRFRDVDPTNERDFYDLGYAG